MKIWLVTKDFADIFNTFYRGRTRGNHFTVVPVATIVGSGKLLTPRRSFINKTAKYGNGDVEQISEVTIKGIHYWVRSEIDTTKIVRNLVSWTQC